MWTLGLIFILIFEGIFGYDSIDFICIRKIPLYSPIDVSLTGHTKDFSVEKYVASKFSDFAVKIARGILILTRKGDFKGDSEERCGKINVRIEGYFVQI